MCILHDIIKLRCDHYDAVNRIEICLKIRRQPILASKFIIVPTIHCAHLCDVASRVAEAMVSKLTVHASTHIVELFVQSFVENYLIF